VRICAYLARLVGVGELGRDLAQDTFIAAWRGLPQVSGELRFGPWLYRIATNTAGTTANRTASAPAEQPQAEAARSQPIGSTRREGAGLVGSSAYHFARVR
jgi:DNA-directed RNA polymerase specialized sigma24 family protein